MKQEKLLFEDKDVKITDRTLTIKCYYFPIATSKKILLTDILRVEVRPLGIAKLRLWGMDAMEWGYWFPGDCSRCSRDNYVAIYTGKCVTPSFTTENTNIIFQILSNELSKLRG
jgi:hypothetical protein